MLDKVFSLRSTLSDIEESSLFYISRYLSFKEGLALKDAVDDLNFLKNSEFLLLQSRGKLSYPPAEFFDLCCILFCYYKNVNESIINESIIYLLVLTKFMKVVNWNTSQTVKGVKTVLRLLFKSIF